MAVLVDSCGPLGPRTNIRRQLSATFTAPFSGPALLDIYNWKNEPCASLNVNFIDNIRVAPVVPDFTASPREISCSSGGSSTLILNPGQAWAGRSYIIVSCLSGTWPGVTLNGVPVPLNLDCWTRTAFGFANTPWMKNFLGCIDPLGTAEAELACPVFPQPHMAGRVAYFCYLLVENTGPPTVIRASHPVNVLLIP